MNRLKDINWNHLYGFHEVAKAQSLKQAAISLKLAPSTLSEQLKKLEARFAKKLFNRSSKGLTLTTEGQALFEHSKIIFEEGSRVLEKFSDDDIGGYSVNIGIEETISYDLSIELASQYWDNYAPFGTVNTLRQAEHDVLIDNLLQDNIDWGISHRKPKRKSLNYAEVGSFEVVFCCSTKLYKKFKNKKDLLINIPFAESSWDKSLNKAIYQHLRKNDIIPKERIYSDHPDFIKNLCLRGRCAMFLAKNPLKKYPGLKTFDLDIPLTISLYAIWKKRDENLISIKKLQELIQSKLSQLPERYEDVELQIEISNIDDDLLT
ncbi:LysR family transcriptional regulator [Halobacteriovorax sp. HLS]|uniref:LysR family transcriptional regulator n=1 Tax=Halobacteriovorax sp. HLS TaxID=2234000 RepID=UPI000FD9EAD5|nr:LysR family transcriptional regulator [Halobacteriovorax sp. HLS]